jgi:GGDEF domain-containing protein
MTDRGSILEGSSSVLKDMFDKSITKNVDADLGADAAHITQQTRDRITASKKHDALNFLSEAVAHDEDRNKGLLDHLTGLKTARSYHADLTADVAERMRSEEQNSTETLHVVRIDLGMLGAVNAEKGHSGGDKYKKFIAEQLINPLHKESFDSRSPLVRAISENFSAFDAYILGGDEFALRIVGDHAKMLEYMHLVEQRLVSMQSETLDVLPGRFHVGRMDLMDWGAVEFNSEARKDFLQSNSYIHSEEDAHGDFVRCAKFLDEIADTKSDMKKMYKRIKLLLRLRQLPKRGSYSEYDFISQFSVKATWGITDTELAAMEESKEPDFLVKSYVNNTLRNRQQRDTVETQDPFSSHIREYIASKVPTYMNDL